MNATSKLVKAWESKNAKNAARAGGISMMALSLAACGGSSTTTTTTTDTTATDTTTTTVATAQTFTLTSGVDVESDFTGGDAGDTFVADNTPALDASSTADTINGGSGADTLVIYSDGAAPGLPALKSIETLKVYDQDDNLTLDAVDQASVTTVNMERGDGALSLTVPVNVVTVGLANMVLDGTGGLTGITVAGAATATSMTLNLDRMSTNAGTTDENIALTGAKIATVTVNTSGTKSSVDDLDAAAAATININAAVDFTASNVLTTSTVGTLNITGAGKVSIGALDDGIDAVAAGTATGAITMTAPNDNADAVITLGSGADVFTTDDDGFAATDKFAVDAGAGTDTLVQAAAADFDTAAEGARYTNFETLRSAVDQDMSLVTGLTGLEVTGGTAKSYTKMTAAQLGNVTFTGGNTTSTTFTLSDATGTADSATFTLASATATTNVDVIGVAVVGVETVNIVASTGTNTSGDSDFGFLANSGDSVKAVNISGSADVDLNIVANTFDVVAATIDASGLTGTGHLEITGGVLLTGSKVTGSDNGDTIAVSSTTGVTYATGAGNDALTGSLADLVQTGSDDTKIDGGAGTDKITLDDTTTTLTDNHFMGVSNMETLALSNTVGDLVITTGAAFNTAFASGATITTGTLAATKDIDFNGGLASVGIKLTVDATSITGAATDVQAIDTGSGDDTVTFTGDATYVGVAGAAGGTITIDTNAGDDTISVTVGTLLSDTTHAITITGGTGQDKITKVGVNADDAQGVAHFVIAAGDSTTTAYDTVVGFDTATASVFSDGLLFDGTAAIGTVATHNDFGTIASSSTTAGVAQFDDAAGFATALVISATNLADVIGYLAANTAANDTVSFAFDKDANGTNDSTMVYHNSTTDSLVLLDGLTGVDSLITTNASTSTGDLFIA